MDTTKIALTVSEVADALNISRPTVYKLMQRADFPVLRIGRRTLVHRARLEEWAARQAEVKEE